MSRFSLPSIVLGVTTVLSLLACGDVAGYGGTGGVSGYYTTGDCSQYGEVCEGMAPQDGLGAFEFIVFPYDDAQSVTFTVTFKDVNDGNDVVEVIDAYPYYNADGGQEFWFYSPRVPSEGYVEVEAEVWLDHDTSIPMFSSQAPEGDWLAMSNGYEVESNDYSSSGRNYAKVNLRDMVED